jgi:DNA-binding beta-propeller fold protein YncE
VAVRGENYISVIDPVRQREIRHIETANGPGVVLFRPDGKYAFVSSGFTPEMDVIDTANLSGDCACAADESVLSQSCGRSARGLVYFCRI